MVRRLTTDQEIAGSNPASVRWDFFFFQEIIFPKNFFGPCPWGSQVDHSMEWSWGPFCLPDISGKQKKKIIDRRRIRTCNLLIRSQAPYHWASRPTADSCLLKMISKSIRWRLVILHVSSSPNFGSSMLLLLQTSSELQFLIRSTGYSTMNRSIYPHITLS